MLVLVEGIGKLRLETRPGECGECSSFVTLFFAKKSLTKTDRCAGALSWRRNQTLVLCFPRLFFLTAFLRRRMVSIHISLFTVILPANPCKLYGRIPGTFWCYHIYHRHHHVPKRLGCFLFLDPQHEVGPSISSSVVLCSLALLVHIVVLVLVVCLCPSSVHDVATFSGTVLFPLLCSVLPFFD